MSYSNTIELARELVRRNSITPDDAGCQEILSERLAESGFSCEPVNSHDVSNLWATRGRIRPLFVFAGHTDVVPTGPLDQWSHPPFEGVIEAGMLHGRGAADMKGSIAAFVTACERLVRKHPDHDGTIGLLITSDEEGEADWGTTVVVDELQERGIHIDMCLVGEPTSVQTLGDTAKIGRRGSLNGKLTLWGKQGHIAYPHLADNPIHSGLDALQELVQTDWDQGNRDFQPTCFQFSNIHGGTGAANVIPGHIDLQFNFRYSPASTHTDLIGRMEEILKRHGMDFRITEGKPAYPYYTTGTELIEAVETAVREVTGITADFSTTGGTSDGRFIAPTGAQVVELGPVNATIHQIDERVSTEDLDRLSHCYERILEKLLVR
ncbi:MAG: succinyl-diaminopimelate desuccinylase [Gammaproteobacteria bacterium]|nr:succinyl-diaminopimelate desuccinylase [Gammaproteobacteria bacterium]